MLECSVLFSILRGEWKCVNNMCACYKKEPERNTDDRGDLPKFLSNGSIGF